MAWAQCCFGIRSGRIQTYRRQCKGLDRCTGIPVCSSDSKTSSLLYQILIKCAQPITELDVDVFLIPPSDYGGGARDPHACNKMVAGSAEQAHVSLAAQTPLLSPRKTTDVLQVMHDTEQLAHTAIFLTNCRCAI